MSLRVTVGAALCIGAVVFVSVWWLGRASADTSSTVVGAVPSIHAADDLVASVDALPNVPQATVTALRTSVGAVSGAPGAEGVPATGEIAVELLGECATILSSLLYTVRASNGDVLLQRSSDALETRLSAVPVGSWKLELRNQRSLLASVDVRVEAGASTELVLGYEPRSRISGIVVDVLSGQAIPVPVSVEFEWWLRRDDGPNQYRAGYTPVELPAGVETFCLADPPHPNSVSAKPGEQRQLELSLRAEGYADALLVLIENPDLVWDDVVIELSPLASVSGVARSVASGEGLAAYLRLVDAADGVEQFAFRPRLDDEGNAPGWTRADPSGAFSLGVIPGREQMLLAWHAEHARWRSEPIVVAPTEAIRRDVFMEQAGSLSGLFLGAETREHGSLGVAIRPLAEAVPQKARAYQLGDFQLLTELGEFAYEQLLPGGYELTLFEQQATGQGTSVVSALFTHQVSVVGGATTELVFDDLVQGSASVRGRALRPPELAEAEGVVQLMRDGTEVSMAVIQSDGSFGFTGVVAGEYLVLAACSAEGVQSFDMAARSLSVVEGGQHELNLDMRGSRVDISSIPGGAADAFTSCRILAETTTPAFDRLLESTPFYVPHSPDRARIWGLPPGRYEFVTADTVVELVLDGFASEAPLVMLN